MGVSASHLDWTMVPYVKKSFLKHFKKGLKYIEKLNENEIENIVKENSINGKEICFSNEALRREFPGAFEYGIELTESEVHQAVEGMYHNLNTLQSRSGGLIAA